MSTLADWAPRVYRFALRLTGDRHAAEDLAQETCLRAWRNRKQVRDERAERVWLFRIAANLWRDGLRRGSLPPEQAGPLTGQEIGHAMSTEHSTASREELSRALAALSSLPSRQREVLYLNACEELSSAEIADVLGISGDAVKANLSLARKRMREQLNDPEELRSR